MIDFDTELAKFELSPEIDEAEEAIYKRDVTDLTDILVEVYKEASRNSRQLR